MSELMTSLRRLLSEYLADLDVIQGRVLDQIQQRQIDLAQPMRLNLVDYVNANDPGIEELRAIIARREELLKLAQSQGISVSNLQELALWLDDSERTLVDSVRLMKRKMDRVYYSSLSHWVSCQKAWLHYSDLAQLIAGGGRKSAMRGHAGCSVQGGVILDAKV